MAVRTNYEDRRPGGFVDPPTAGVQPNAGASTRILDLNSLVADMSKLLRRLVREDIEFGFLLGDSLGRVRRTRGRSSSAVESDG